MKSKFTKTTIIIFSVLFVLRVLTIFTADRLCSLNLLNIAIKLDSTNSDLYYQQYQIDTLQPKLRLQALKKCINLVPSWPVYHLYYGLMLKKMSPNPNPLTKKLILSELSKASELKPSSELYSAIAQQSPK